MSPASAFVPEIGYQIGPWIGAYQDRTDPSYSEPAGGWKWVTGEPTVFTDWGPTLDNAGGVEDYGQIIQYGSGVAGMHWNDFPSDPSSLFGTGIGVKGYLVEAEPQPGSLLLNENFNGGFSEDWDLNGDRIPRLFFEGVADPGWSPVYSFGSIAGSSALVMQAPTDNYGRFGFSSIKTFGTGIFAEARVNTMDHASGTNMEQFAEFWLVNANDSSKFVYIAIHNGWCGTARYVTVASSPGNGGMNITDVPWTDNQWYRLQIKDDPIQGVVLSLVDDSGTNTLVRYVVGQPLSAIGSAFNVGFSQFRLPYCGTSAKPTAAVDSITVRQQL